MPANSKMLAAISSAPSAYTNPLKARNGSDACSNPTTGLRIGKFQPPNPEQDQTEADPQERARDPLGQSE